MPAARDGERAVRARDPEGAINALAGHPASSCREAIEGSDPEGNLLVMGYTVTL